MGDPFSPSGKAHVIAKHPPAEHPLSELDDHDFPAEPSHQCPSCRDFIRNLPRNKGASLDENGKLNYNIDITKPRAGII